MVSHDSKQLRQNVSGDSKQLRQDVSGDSKQLRQDVSGDSKQLRQDVSADSKQLRQDVLNEALAMVMKTHSLDMIQYLIGKGADANTTSIYQSSLLAAICGDYYVNEDNNIDIAKLLISHGAQDLSGAMCGAAYNYCVRLLEYLICDAGAPATGYQLIGPITRAGFNDQYQVPQILLQHGADPNFLGSINCTALLWAAFHGAENTVKLLLYGANPDSIAELCLESSSPLHTACVRNYISVIALFVQFFCDVNQLATVAERRLTCLVPHMYTECEKKFTVLETLYLCTATEHLEQLSELLIEAGAKVRPSFRLLVQPCYWTEKYDSIQDYFSQPPPLLLLCRVTIRQCLKGKNIRTIQRELPLPDFLKHNVLMTSHIQPLVRHLKHFDVQYKPPCD